MTRQAERTRATRALLIDTGRRIFAERGYAAVPAEALVRAAALTRGALYHHFGGKDGLFAAVYEEIQREVVARVDAAAEAEPDAWRGLRAGCHAFLESCVDPEVRRIVLIDAPAVLSWDAWRQVDVRYGLGSLKAGLEAARAEGWLAAEWLDAVAHLLLGAMNEAALWIARASDPSGALAAAKAELDRLLAGLRAAG